MEETIIVTHPFSDFEHLPYAGTGLDTHTLGSRGAYGLVVWTLLGLTLLFKGLKASIWVQLWEKNNPNTLLLSSFPLLCMSVRLSLSLCLSVHAPPRPHL